MILSPHSNHDFEELQQMTPGGACLAHHSNAAGLPLSRDVNSVGSNDLYKPSSLNKIVFAMTRSFGMPNFSAIGSII
jgi:hypothetical protein